MKLIFLDLRRVLIDDVLWAKVTGCGYTPVQLGGYINPTSLYWLGTLCKRVQNCWFILGPSFRSELGYRESCEMLRSVGFEFSHRILESVECRKTDSLNYEVCQWLRLNAEENEVGSFLILTGYNIGGYLGPYNYVVDSGITRQDVDRIVDGFNSREYRLDKVWHTIRLKSR